MPNRAWLTRLGFHCCAVSSLDGSIDGRDSGLGVDSKIIKRLVSVTAGALRNSHLRISEHCDFFSADGVGGSKVMVFLTWETRLAGP